MQDAGYRMQEGKIATSKKLTKGFQDLEIYQLSHRLAVEIHKLTLSSLPKFEQFEEGSQIRRSSKSVPSNIVEGFGRRAHKADFLKFLIFAHSSCDETLEHLTLLRDTGSLLVTIANQFLERYTSLSRKICRFIESVKLYHRY